MIGTAERKNLINFCYIAPALTGFTVSTRNGALFAAAIAEYWRCEIAGVSPENSCDGQSPGESFEQFTYPELTASFILVGIFSAMNLVFAVSAREIKQKFKTWPGMAECNILPLHRTKYSQHCNYYTQELYS